MYLIDIKCTPKQSPLLTILVLVPEFWVCITVDNHALRQYYDANVMPNTISSEAEDG